MCRSPAKSHGLSNPFQTATFTLSPISLETKVGLGDDRIQYRIKYYRGSVERALVTGLVCPPNEGCSWLSKTPTLPTPCLKPFSTHIHTPDETMT